MKEVEIKTDFIKLSSLLKLIGSVSTGGSAKSVITGEKVSVNGAICTMRGKKLREGDVVSFEGQDYIVKVR